MELVLLITIIAIIIFAADFVRGLPGYALMSLGLAVLSVAFGLFIWHGWVADKL